MSYTYPEALNAMEKIAIDLLQAVFPGKTIRARVVADADTGTASVTWEHGYVLRVTVYMPVRPTTYRMTSDEFTHWAAYILHEVGHPAHTDKAVWDAAVARNAHRLLNALEDVREEKATIDLGLANNALAVFSRLIDMLHVKAAANGYNPNDPCSIGWTMSALGRRANGYAVDLSDIDAKLDPKGTVGQIVAWAVPALGKATSTQDCMDLADRIVAAINAAHKPEPEIEIDNGFAPPLPGMPSSATEEAAGELEQGGMGDPLPLEPLAPTAFPDSDEPEADEPEAEVPEDVADEVAGAGGEDFSDADIAEVDMRPNDMGNMVSKGRDTAVQDVLTRILRREGSAKPREREITGRNRNGVCEMVAGKASKMGLQRALLAKALKAEDIDSYDGGRSHGRLNTRALAKLASGNTQVFGKRTTIDGYDTDVQVLVDGSSSMAGLKMDAASTLALVVSQAASQVGVDCFVHVFHDDGLDIVTGGKARPVGKKFGYMALSARGSTPLTERMLQVAKLQNERAGNKRRILFVITDGACNSGIYVAKAAGEHIERVMGVEIANLHIGSTVPGMFRNEVAVRADKVNEAGLKQFTRLLERGI